MSDARELDPVRTHLAGIDASRFDWNRLVGCKGVAEALAEIRRYVGPKLLALEVSRDGARLGRWAVAKEVSPPDGDGLRLAVAGDPPWVLEARFAPGAAEPREDLLGRAVLLFEAWRHARQAVDRVLAGVAERGRELDLLQAMGRTAAEAQTPEELFGSALSALHRGVEIDLALAGFGSEGDPVLCAFTARPVGSALLADLAGRAARLLGAAADAGPPCPAQLEGHDAARGTRTTIEEQELVVLPLMRRGRPAGCLLVVPTEAPDERRTRLLFGAANQIALHLDRILTVREAEVERLRAMVDSMPQGVLLADERLRVLQVNASARHLFRSAGFDDLDSLERLQDTFGLRALIEAVRGGEAGAEGEVRLEADRVWGVTVSPVRGRRRLEGVLVVVTDLTANHRMQRRLAQSEKMSALGQLLSGVAHELNNPLASIVGYAQLARARGGDDETLTRNLATLRREAERCRHIVGGLLSFARQREPETRPLSLNQVAQGVLSLLAYQMAVDNIELRARLSPRLPPVQGDPHQLEQALVNLLTNARQALRSTGRPGRIELRTDIADSGAVVLEIEDDGPGIPESVASRIFEPFFTTKPPGEGTGLGLSLVEGIVRAHGGTIRVLPGPQRGTVFHLTFPADFAARRPAAEAPAEPTGAERVAPAHVLVVEDEEPLGRLICEALAPEGHTTEHVRDAGRALERLARAGVDLVISDLRMPGMDGDGLHEQIRRRHPHLASRLLLTTGDTLSEETATLARRTGAGVLHKPFDVDDLRRRVRALLSGERS